MARDEEKVEAEYGSVRWWAQVTNTSPRSVARLIKKEPTFPVVKIGGALRIPKERARRWLAKRTQGGK
jgi:hypothetical protein